MTSLELVDISKDFGKLKALVGINLEIKQGQFCVVLGPSGCGKSTLLNVIAGLEEADSGKIYFEGKDITKLPVHKRDIAFVFQNYALYPHLSVYENMAFGLRIKGLMEKDIRVRIRATSELLGIKDKLENFPGELSGAQKQRVATGRAIVREPKLFLFDEPLSNLDARLRVQSRTEFIKLHKQFKKTTIYVTHDQQEALALGELIVVLKDGQIQQIGAPSQIYHDPANLFIAGFMGMPAMNIIQAKVTRFEEKLVLKNLDFKLVIPLEFQAKLERHNDNMVYLGFRPTAVKISEGGELVGEIIFTQTLEEDHYAHISLSQDVEITMKIDEGLALSSTKLVRLKIDAKKMYFFDEHGKRIEL
ncbi:MAG: ABC transporter ATP-binding protein [Candidatus Omnitrophica bacterium]|nr:ABC transporter ATP-binding protein [Candidatus Omnitrophota bacterium]